MNGCRIGKIKFKNGVIGHSKISGGYSYQSNSKNKKMLLELLDRIDEVDSLFIGVHNKDGECYSGSTGCKVSNLCITAQQLNRKINECLFEDD